jgi:hypothetical protein
MLSLKSFTVATEVGDFRDISQFISSATCIVNAQKVLKLETAIVGSCSASVPRLPGAGRQGQRRSGRTRDLPVPVQSLGT